MTHRLDQIRGGAHWREIIGQIIDVAAERRQGANGAAGLRIAMKVSLELQPYDRAESIESARFVADMLIARAGVDALTAARVGRVAIEVGGAVLDLLLQEEAADQAAWVGEAKAAVCNYLAPYFEDRACD